MVTLHLPCWAGACLQIATKPRGPRRHTIVHQQHFLKGTDNNIQGSPFSHQNQGHLSRTVAILLPKSPFLLSIPSAITLSEVTGLRTTSKTVILCRKGEPRDEKEGEARHGKPPLFGMQICTWGVLRDFEPLLWRCSAPYGRATFLLWGGNTAINIVIWNLNRK